MTNFLSDRQYQNWCRNEETALEMLRDHNIIRVEAPSKFMIMIRHTVIWAKKALDCNTKFVINYFSTACPTCNGEMTEVKRGTRANWSRIWRCPGHKNQKRGLKSGSMFEGTKIRLINNTKSNLMHSGQFVSDSHLTFVQIVGLLHNFAKETSLSKAAPSLELHQNTVCFWYKVRFIN